MIITLIEEYQWSEIYFEIFMTHIGDSYNNIIRVKLILKCLLHLLKNISEVKFILKYS